MTFTIQYSGAIEAPATPIPSPQKKPINDGEKLEIIRELIREVYDFSISDLMSRDRHADLAFARQVGMMLSMKLTRLTNEKVAKFWNRECPQTVMWAVGRVMNAINTNDSERILVDHIMERAERAFANYDGIEQQRRGSQ